VAGQSSHRITYIRTYTHTYTDSQTQANMTKNKTQAAAKKHHQHPKNNKAIARKPQPRPRKKKKNHPSQHENKRVVMTPEAKMAMQAITSPFKAVDNTAKFPDGAGGESFSTTDKLRRSENNTTWLADIKKANEQWMRYSTQFVARESGDVTQSLSGPLPVSNISSLSSAFKGSQPSSGWNILANNCPVYPFATDSPVSLSDKYVDSQTWKDIEINKVYYFAVPGVQIDATRGNFGGPLNNFNGSAPNGGAPGSTADYPDATTATLWQAEHDLELQQIYSMQLSAPMQVYRVLDFTYEIQLDPPSAFPDHDTTSLDHLRKALETVYPNLSDNEILNKIVSMEAAVSVEDPHRYRCQVITPLAGVTQWKDFSDQLGRTLYRSANFPILNPPPASQEECARSYRGKVDDREFDVRSLESGSSRVSFKDPPHHMGYGNVPDVLTIAPSQAADAGPFEFLHVADDYTYYQGHNGLQSLGSKMEVNLATLKVGSPNNTPDYGLSCTSACIEFRGGLVEARRTVGFGMKLFSTEAALTANGRICGGELPLGLVTDLLNFQDQEFAHPIPNAAGPGPLSTMDWSPLHDNMDEWTEKIESRMDDFTAYTAIDGCTVRYNTLQTEEQQEYIYTNNDSRLTFTPLQMGFVDKPLLPGPQSAMSSSRTMAGRIRAEIPMPYHPACDGSEMVPIILYAPSDPVRINYSDAEDDPSREDGLYFQAVLHTENLTSNQFPMEVEESVYDPNWELYCRICCETQNFPIVVKGHSFGSFMRKAGRVTRTAMKFGAKAIEVGEVLLPLLAA
jgi:hypothetical protein